MRSQNVCGHSSSGAGTYDYSIIGFLKVDLWLCFPDQTDERHDLPSQNEICGIITTNESVSQHDGGWGWDLGVGDWGFDLGLVIGVGDWAWRTRKTKASARRPKPQPHQSQPPVRPNPQPQSPIPNPPTQRPTPT